MAINIKFDLVGNPEPPTIILATRNGRKLGQLDVDEKSIELSDKFNDASEITFTLNKYVDGKLTNLWDKVVNFKLIYCKEWDLWFEATVELDEETETIKTVFCKQLGQAELSQLMLYNIEINTEADIERDDYKIAILYDKENPDASILHRLLKDKAPHYSIIHVDSTIARLQRSFSFDGISIYDAFMEIAEEIGCLFVFHSNSDEKGKIQRTISVYDLWQNCNDCGHRGEFTDVCPKCGSKSITNGYGEDTLIFVTADELANGDISLTTDTDSVKNCFKLEAGDDLMTATIRNCNPNGSDYIWRLSDSMKEDMSNELVEKLDSYDKKYRRYYYDNISELDAELLGKYNALVDKYLAYDKELQKIIAPIKGYSALMNAYYNTIDLALYLESGLMPSVTMSKTTAIEQARLLTTSSLSPVSVTNVDIASLATVNNAVLSMAKIIVKSTYKVQIGDSSMVGNGDTKTWTGNFVVTNYSDEEDTATSNTISVTVNGNYESFVKQKIDKALNKENTDDLSISGLFKKDYDDFCKELKKYALNPLISFYDACQACIDILIEQGIGNDDTWADTDEGADSNLYEKLYVPYYDKLMAIESEMKIREDEIAIISGAYDVNDVLITDGLQTCIEKCKTNIQDALNFEKHLGTDLWLEFCSYRREDTYSNDNYISDGLDNAELFQNALDFIEVAENEIYKSSESQHSISSTLNNLLAIPKFKQLVESFSVGNWIRARVDGKIYKLRLLDYDIDYSNFDNISVTFSDVVNVKNGITDIESILSQASSMATSYDSIQRQAKQGNDAQETIDQWLSYGLNTALVQIQNNNNEDITITKNGLLCRSYNDITESYSPEQFRLTHNIMAYTTDNWKTASAALGKHGYTKWENNQWIQDEDYGLSATFVTAGYVTGSQIIGGEIVSSNYKSGERGTYFNLIDGDFELAGGRFIYDDENKQLSINNVSIDWSSSTNPDIDYVVGLTDRLNGLSTRIQVNSESITSEVSRATKAEGSLSSRITQTAESITSEVSKKVNGSEIISTINQSAEQISISASKIKFEGLVTANNNFKILEDGSIEAKNANISGTIVATNGTFGDISVKTINGIATTSASLNGGFDVSGQAKTDFDNLVVNNITADNIIATNVLTDYATIGSLNATNARISNIEADYVNAGYVDAAIINADYVTAGEVSGIIANFGYVTADYVNSATINADRLVAGTINGQAVAWQNFPILTNVKIRRKTVTIGGKTITYVESIIPYATFQSILTNAPDEAPDEPEYI